MVTFGKVREDNATVDDKVVSVSAKASSSGPKSARKTSLRYSDSSTTTASATAATTLTTTSITKAATAGQAGVRIGTSATAAGDRTTRKPAVNVRARGPRFGLAQWQRLVRSSKDLAQRKGQPFRKDISLEEVQQHNRPHDGWMVLRGVVYNIGPYLAYHPGGEEILHKVLGKDGTKLFDKYHPWVSIEGLIGTLAIGTLATTTTPEATATTPDETDSDGGGDDESSQ